AETILHELAHMWFGDLVTMRWWDDLWLNESFATYASVVCQAEATKYRTAWTTFANIEKTWAYRQDQLPSTHPVAADIPDVEAVEVNFDGITYAKGASVLRQLAAYVGQDQFFDAMKVYFKRHEYGNTTFADLLAVLSEVSGRDLSDWSEMWLATSQVNTLRPTYELDTDGNYSSFAVLQSAVPEHPVLRRHRLAVGLYSAGPQGVVRTKRVELDVEGERTDVSDIVGLPAADLVLVNDDDLTYAKLRLDDRSLATLIDRIGELTDSLARTLCWSAAWDMTRDAEWAGRDYVRLVLAGIDAEDEISVVQALLRQVQTALATFVDPSRAPTGWAQLADKAWQGLQGAPAGSDVQLAWSRTFAAAARTDQHADRLRALLDGSLSIDGLTVDAEARWALLNGLVAIGAAGDAQIEDELQRDPTSTGQRRAATARALQPASEAKERAWALGLSEDVPNAVQEATLLGFWHPAQTEICRPYADRFFAEVDEIWERRPGEIAKNVAAYLFPAVVEQSTLDAADAWLAEESHPSALRRLITESRDGIARALRCQTRDAQTDG
ncbi:MAG: aminopeptidase N, partial [Geodermatophilaceae bacterium]|nr:aminopeptidase N [Geodermatophilaceae bacterium]